MRPKGDWRSLMEPTRQAAKQLAQQGVIQITQKGQVVDPDNFKGPIRLRLASSTAAGTLRPQPGIAALLQPAAAVAAAVEEPT